MNMLISLVVLSSTLLQVKTDWVEISQQHYRKPFRPIQAKGKVQVTTESVNIYSLKNNRIYSNQSVNQAWDDNGDLQEASSNGKVENFRRPVSKLKTTGNVIKHAAQLKNEKDEHNEKRLDLYDYDVRHEDLNLFYEISGRDVIVNKRRPINKHTLNDRFENHDKNRQRVDSERHGNKVVRLKNKSKPTEDPGRTNPFKEGVIRKNEGHKNNNVRSSSTTLAPRNISMSKDSTHSSNRRMDTNNPEDVNYNNQNPFKTQGHISGGNRRRIYFFDPPKTDENEDKHIVHSVAVKNLKETNNGRDNPITSTATNKNHLGLETENTGKAPKPNRNKNPSDFTIVFKPESAESFAPSTNKAVKVLEKIPVRESYEQQHKNMYTNDESDSKNEDTILINSPLIQTADDKNPFVTNYYHNINHGNIRRIDFIGNKKTEGDIVEFKENLNKSPESSKNKNNNQMPDKTIQSQKQPYKTGTIKRVQFPEINLGGKLSLTSSTGHKYPDDELPMEHKQINNNGERISDYPSTFTSESPPLEQNSDYDDDDDLVTDGTPIRRLDISSLTSANIPEFITKQEPPDSHEIYKDFIETESTTQKIYTRRLTTVAVKVEESTPNWVDDNVKPSKDEITENPTLKKNEKSEEIKHTPEDVTQNKSNPLENVAKFMKVVSETITKNTQRSIKGKVRYLEQLRDSILTSIEDHIESQWPNDAAHSRGAREARGHVDFPSSEGALMTISFLTFAVFLIKLVLQVIHTYKNKTMMVTPAVYAVSRMAGSAMRRQPENSNN